MALINLIAQERARIRQLEGRSRLVGLAGIGVVMLALLTYGGMALYVASLEQQAKDLQAEMTRLEPVIRELNDTQRKIKALEPQLKTLQSARNDTSRWQRVMAHLSRNTPVSLWVTGIRTGERPNNKTPLTVSISGTADSQERVGELMLRLNNCEDLEKVELRFTQEKMINAFTRGVDFEVVASLKGTAVVQNDQEGNQNGDSQKS